MARHAYAEFVEVWGMIRTRDHAKAEGDLLSWEHLHEDRKTAWRSAMRAAYCRLAITGGAKVARNA